MDKMEQDDLKGCVDLFNLSEDQRINVIGNYVMTLTPDKEVVIAVDDLPGKRERYIIKLYEKFDGVEVFAQGNGPVKGSVYFKVRRKKK
jgi:hypothetical protein